MSYNTRRNNYNVGVNSIGQRRPPGPHSQGNFGHGGQQKPVQQPIQKPVQQNQPSATQKPVQQNQQQPAIQKPVQQPAIQKPVQQPATQKPVQQNQQPATQKPVQQNQQPATQKPVQQNQQPATQKPVQQNQQPAATQKPVQQNQQQPPTQKPAPQPNQQQQQQQQQPSQQQPQQQPNQQPQQQPNQQPQQQQPTTQKPQTAVPSLAQTSQQQLQQLQTEQPPKAVEVVKENQNSIVAPQLKNEIKPENVTPVKAAPPTTGEGVKEKPFWIKKTIRIPRAERVRRRNMRLQKVLQPKNALMVLNELVGQTEYVVTDSKTDYNQDIFNATLTVDGHSFTGTGKSKVSAKTAAAEIAIRAIILKRLRTPGGFTFPNQPQSNLTQIPMEDDVKMEEEQQQNEDLSWSQVASFAIYKLLSNWDDDDGGNLVDLFSTINSTTESVGGQSTPPTSTSLTNLSSEPRPAKKLPENAAHLNPSMLLNQMFPHAKYEEVGRAGYPTNLQFTISCVVDGNTFTGTGPNKKTAKKNAAFEACKALLNINYPPEVYAPEKMQVDAAPF